MGEYKQRLYIILLKTGFATVIEVYVLFLILVEKIKTNIHLEQPFYLLTETWKYGGCVFCPEVACTWELSVSQLEFGRYENKKNVFAQKWHFSPHFIYLFF